MAEIIKLDGSIENISKEQSLDLLSDYPDHGCGGVLDCLQNRTDQFVYRGHYVTCGATDPRQTHDARCINCGGSWKLKN